MHAVYRESSLDKHWYGMAHLKIVVGFLFLLAIGTAADDSGK